MSEMSRALSEESSELSDSPECIALPAKAAADRTAPEPRKKPAAAQNTVLAALRARSAAEMEAAEPPPERSQGTAASSASMAPATPSQEHAGPADNRRRKRKAREAQQVASDDTGATLPADPAREQVVPPTPAVEQEAAEPPPAGPQVIAAARGSKARSAVEQEAPETPPEGLQGSAASSGSMPPAMSSQEHAGPVDKRRRKRQAREPQQVGCGDPRATLPADSAREQVVPLPTAESSSMAPEKAAHPHTTGAAKNRRLRRRRVLNSPSPPSRSWSPRSRSPSPPSYRPSPRSTQGDVDLWTPDTFMAGAPGQSVDVDTLRDTVLLDEDNAPLLRGQIATADETSAEIQDPAKDDGFPEKKGSAEEIDMPAEMEMPADKKGSAEEIEPRSAAPQVHIV